MKLLFIKLLKQMNLSFFIGFIFFGVLFSFVVVKPGLVFAQATCSRVGQCVDNKKCHCLDNIDYDLCKEYLERGDTSVLTTAGDLPCGSAIIGSVDAPFAVSAINSASGGDIGLIFFISRIINFANIIAGIIVMANFIFAGFLYITGAGAAANMAKINEKLTWSIIGILIIVGSYTIAAIFGLIFYGDATFIISPEFTGALDV